VCNIKLNLTITRPASALNRAWKRYKYLAGKDQLPREVANLDLVRQILYILLEFAGLGQNCWIPWGRSGSLIPLKWLRPLGKARLLAGLDA